MITRVLSVYIDSILLTCTYQFIFFEEFDMKMQTVQIYSI